MINAIPSLSAVSDINIAQFKENMFKFDVGYLNYHTISQQEAWMFPPFKYGKAHSILKQNY